MLNNQQIEAEKNRNQNLKNRIDELKNAKVFSNKQILKISKVCSITSYSQPTKKNQKQAEFEDMYDYMTLNVHQHARSIEQFQIDNKPIFDSLYKEFRNLIFDFFRNTIDISIAGSCMTGLNMPWSDLNIVVTFKVRTLTENDIYKNVEKFNEFLKTRKSSVSASEFSERKNITLMRLWLNDAFKNKRVEIIFRRFMIQNLPKTEAIISDFLKTYPISRTIYFVIRKIFHLSDLDNPTEGGINSFSIFLLIIAYLQMIESSTHSSSITKQTKTDGSTRSVSTTHCDDFLDGSPDDQEKANQTQINKYINSNKIGEIFLNLVHFYGSSFDYGKNYISPYISRLSKCHPFYIKPESSLTSLMILNPFDHNIIITKSFKKTMEMKQIFKLIYNHHFSVCSCDFSSSSVFPKNIDINKTQLFFAQICASEVTKKNIAGQSLPLMIIYSKTKNESLLNEVNNTPLTMSGLEPMEKKRSSIKSRLSVNSSIFQNFTKVEEPMTLFFRKNEFGFLIQSMFAFNFI